MGKLKLFLNRMLALCYNYFYYEVLDEREDKKVSFLVENTTEETITGFEVFNACKYNAGVNFGGTWTEDGRIFENKGIKISSLQEMCYKDFLSTHWHEWYLIKDISMELKKGEPRQVEDLFQITHIDNNWSYSIRPLTPLIDDNNKGITKVTPEGGEFLDLNTALVYNTIYPSTSFTITLVEQLYKTKFSWINLLKTIGALILASMVLKIILTNHI